VIGINLSVAQSILGAVGEVFVPDFNEKIDKNNLYEQAEFYAETKFFPGSKQKASFLGALGKQLFEEIKNLKGEKRLALIEVFIDSLERNDLEIVLNNSQSNKKLNDFGWNGAIYQGKCGVKDCYSDFIYLVEANLGVNKANYFLYRNIEEKIDISNQNINREVKINYENTAKNTNWPGGNYKNYLRVYLPLDANVSEISVVEGNNESTRKIYGSEEIKIREANKKKEIGFLVEVPVMKKRTVLIKYNSSISLGTGKFSYANYWQRQPGYGDTGLVSLVSFPNDWQPVQVQPSGSLVGGKLLFNMKLDKDIKMGVELGK
jgi:hypothetical protein